MMVMMMMKGTKMMVRWSWVGLRCFFVLSFFLLVLLSLRHMSSGKADDDDDENDDSVGDGDGLVVVG